MGEFGIGFTSKNEEFYFDLEDYDKIKQYNWYVDSKGYIRKSNPTLYMHRLIMNISDPNIMIDHIYHKKYDNRKSQLRIATCSQNQMNRYVPLSNASGFRGISWHKNKQAWIAQIGINGKLKYLGLYKNIDDAIDARIKAEKYYFGEYNYKIS